MNVREVIFSDAEGLIDLAQQVKKITRNLCFGNLEKEIFNQFSSKR